MILEGGVTCEFGFFSVVAYLPPPLSQFIEPLRSELVAGCSARAHVTVLSPRALCGPARQARAELAMALSDFSPFQVSLGEVRVFPTSEVIFLSVDSGFAELCELHQRTNQGNVRFRDPQWFHPHVTLAQDLTSGSLPRMRSQAADCWARYSGPRDFLVERLHLVERTPQGAYVDVAEFALRSVAAAS